MFYHVAIPALFKSILKNVFLIDVYIHYKKHLCEETRVLYLYLQLARRLQRLSAVRHYGILLTIISISNKNISGRLSVLSH